MQTGRLYQTPEPVFLQEPCEQSLPLRRINSCPRSPFFGASEYKIKPVCKCIVAEGLRRSFVFEQNVEDMILLYGKLRQKSIFQKELGYAHDI